MASIRKRQRADGTTAVAVLYSLDGIQTSVTFDDEPEAERFRSAVDTLGAEKAMRAWGIAVTKQAAAKSAAPTVTAWCEGYIASRTGVTKATLYDYRSYLKHDIGPTIGAIPIDKLSSDDIAAWVQGLTDRGLAGKTVANRHGFLSAALNTAVAAGHISHNPAAGTRIPRTERKKTCFLTADEFKLLHGCFTEHWRPMVRFMVASGARLGELCALRPSDVDRDHNVVHIGRSSKRTYDKDGWELGPTKTIKSVRDLIIDPDVLDALDYSGEWLFTNTRGGPVRGPSFRNNVWYPAVKKAQAKGLRKSPRIHDMRHTCASLMIAGGANLYAVQRHLGHESISTTVNLYGHLDRKDAEAAANIIGAALRW